MSDVARDYGKTLIGNGRAIEPHPLPLSIPKFLTGRRALLIHGKVVTCRFSMKGTLQTYMPGQPYQNELQT